MKPHLVSMLYFGDSQLFESATNYTSVFSYVKNSEITAFIFTNAEKFHRGENLSASINKNKNLIKKSDLTDDSWELENSQNISVLNKIKAISNITLDNIANIEYGLVTGSDKILVFKKGKLPSLENKPFVFPLLRPSETSRYCLAPSNYFVIYPYKKENGSTTITREKEIKSKSLEVYQYLKNIRKIWEKEKILAEI